MTHTPGPWKYLKVGYLLQQDKTPTFEISSPEGTYWIAHALTEEDAQLIAAAPEMLDMLKAVKDYVMVPFDRGCSMNIQIVELIAKAEGAATSGPRKAESL